MTLLTRRTLLAGGAAALAAPCRPTWAAGRVVEIRMRGNKDGSRVWFDPIGVLIQPGDTLRWIGTDAGNSHTATAYHPDNDNRALRIPAGAKPWNSDYLLPNEKFDVRLTVEGVYDYLCIPHEHAGMVGRLVVGRPVGFPFLTGSRKWQPLPEIALKGFPDTERIVAEGAVRYEG
jgi:plastocyanin